ncbi:MAG: extracellular solute-binding protein, partial [Clostridiales bacterium]|nr:extracellular solute-binding protein [Clostridiales bacterium]
MSKKTWSTILVVVLIVAAAVGIYFATKPAPAPEATPTPEPVVETTAPATEVPVTEAPAATATAEPLTTPGPVEEGKIGVNIWHTFTKGQEAYLQKAAADFNASQDKIQVQVLSQPYSGFTQAVKSAVVEGIGPDIIFNYASEAASYVRAGQVADLSQYIYDDELGIKDFDSSLAEGVMKGEVNGFEDGLIHYVPAYTTGPILFYNKTLFDELKIAPPTTWEEMETTCKTIYDAKGIAGLGCDSLTDLIQMFIMEAPNSGYIDVEKKAVLFDTPEVRAKLQWLVDMVKKGYFLVQSSGNYFSEDFNSGIVASYIGSCAGYPYIKPNGFEFAMAPIPAKTWYPSWNRGPIV